MHRRYAVSSAVPLVRCLGFWWALIVALMLPVAASAQVVLDDFNPSANQGVQALAQQTDGKLLVGGDFTHIGGVNRNRLARFNADGSLDEHFDPNVNGWVYSIVVQPDGKILIGGSFSLIGGSHTRIGLARLNVNGSVDTGFVPPTIQPHGDGRSVFRVLRLTNGQVLIAGHFLDVGGSGRAKMARLNANGSLDASFQAVTFANNDHHVWSLAQQANGKIVVGGGFTQINGVSRTNLARLESNGQLDALFDAGVRIAANTNGSTATIIVQPDQRIFVVGNFNQAIGTGGTTRTTRNVVRFNANGTIDESFSTNTASTNASVHWAARQSDGKMLIGGDFTQASALDSPTIPRSKLARLNTDGSVDEDFDPPTINGSVWTVLAQADSRVVIGGNLTNVGGASRQRIARLAELGPMGGVAQVSGGGHHTCALTMGGLVKCWGGNDDGQLGDGTTTSRLTPGFVAALDKGVQAVSTGLFHTCALTTDGEVWCWGRNDDGQLGDGSRVNRSNPVHVWALPAGSVQAISVGASHTCVLTTAGDVWCWGLNRYGQLGNNSAADYHATPVMILRPSGLTGPVQAISVGMEGHTCALADTGRVWCWGLNRYGQLGNNSTINSRVPVQVSQTSGLSSPVQAISAGGGHTCALTTTGVAWCWGWNLYGQLGISSFDDQRSPVQVFGFTGPLQTISTGTIHNCALTTAGVAWCWGDNHRGQLGDNSTTNRRYPVQVSQSSGLTSTVLAISTHVNHVCALTAASAAWCWGWNERGQLGDNTTTKRLVPVPVLAPISGSDTIFRNGFD